VVIVVNVAIYGWLFYRHRCLRSTAK